MDEEWRTIPAFPNYSVSNTGHVRLDRLNRTLHPSKNQQGHLKVNLVKNGNAYTRHVNHLIAKAYLSEPTRRDFTSVIHLDGNKANCAAENLAWRPRYFAIKYHLQFDAGYYKNTVMAIENTKTGEKFKSIQDAVTHYGLLFNDIIASIHTRTYVWPTYQEFRVI
jgi:hypothetical protein